MSIDGMVKIKKERGDSIMPSSEAYYPYGTSLSLDDDTYDACGCAGMAVGDEVMVMGVGTVESKNESESGEGSHKSIRIQLTGIKVKRKDPDAAATLYGG